MCVCACARVCLSYGISANVHLAKTCRLLSNEIMLCGYLRNYFRSKVERVIAMEKERVLLKRDCLVLQ